MRIVRSNHAHANIVSIDTEAARALPGVVAVWTAADIADVPPIDFREGPIEKLAPYRQPVLAIDKVRYVGEPVAAVFAEDPYVAEDAADLVTIEVEELPPLLDARDEPGEFSFGRDTEADGAAPRLRRRRCGVQSARAYRRAASSPVGRHSGVPLESRGAIGRYDASRDVLELHGAAKVPHRNKELIARMLNRTPSSVQCYESHVGGGFGIRGELYPEDMLVCVAAMRLERAGEMDRGPPRASDRRQPFAQPASPHPRRGHRRRRNPRHRRRDLPRQRRLRSHPRHPRRDDDLRRAAGAVSRARRLSRGLPFPPDQQDAGRDLSRAGPLRDHASCASGWSTPSRIS